MRHWSWVGTAMAMVWLTAAPCAAVPVTLNAVDSGWYAADGLHVPGIENYVTGRVSGSEDRSFFVFDLSGVSGTIQSATLRLFNPEVSQFLHGYSSPDPTETLNLYDVSTPAAVITGGTAGVAGFADLGTGTLYGSRIVSAADNGTVIDITLNSAALTNLNASTSLFLLGGALGTLGSAADQFVFGFSMTDFVSNHTRQLVLDVAEVPVPEPSTLALSGIGALALMIRRRYRGERKATPTNAE